MADLAPVFSAQPDTHNDQPAHERECPGCGGAITVPAGDSLPVHNAYVVGPGGAVREGDTPCDGHRPATTRTKEQP